MKYALIFPDRFHSLAAARTCLHTPADVHYGHADTTQARRIDTLTAARAKHPTRFTTPTVIPKILALPETAWINKPEEDDETNAA